MLRHHLLLAATLLITLAARAQPSPNRFPYPLTYGLGLPFLNDNAQSIRSLGMGGVGMAVPEEAYINDFNPAQLVYNSTNLMLDADLVYGIQARTYFDRVPARPSEVASRAAPLSKFRIPGFRVAYPIFPGVMVAKLSYHPARIYNFSTTTLQTIVRPDALPVAPEPDTLVRVATGTAKLRQYSLGLGFTMIRSLAGGLQVDYLTGTFSAASASRYFKPDTPERVDTSVAWTDAGRLRTWRITGAVAHRLRLSETLALRSALSVTWSLPLKASGGPAAESGVVGVQPGRVTTRIPILARGGLSVSNDRTWRVAADGLWQRWSQYRSFSGASRYNDGFSLSVGAEVTPGGINAESLLKRSTYRAGFSYARQPREELTRPVTEISFAGGASFPVTSVLETRRSYINLGLRVGQAFYPESDVFRATIFEIGAGFTFNSRLYIQVGRGNCPIPSCHVRKKHMHDGTEYTGQPWFKKQNPHIGEKLPYRKPSEKPKSNDRRRYQF